MIAFEWIDPNDGNNSNTGVRFVRWSRAAYKWLPPVRAQIIGDIQSQNLNPISIACDRKTGMLVIVTPVVDKSASILLSKDGGASWTTIPIPGVAGTITSTALAIVDGTAHLALAAPESGAYYFTGSLDKTSAWKGAPLPSVSGWKPALNANLGLAIDKSGQPLIAWYETQEEGGGRRFQVWRPGSQSGTALTTQRDADSPDLAITAGAGAIGLLVQTPLDEKDDDHGVWYTQSKDGAAWSKPSKPPIDGSRTTNPPMDVAIDSKGHIIAVFGSNSGSDSTTCNYPALSRSNDGVAWKTCGPGKAEGGDFSPQPATLHVIEAGDDKAYVLWQETGDNKYHEGMLLWHEQ